MFEWIFACLFRLYPSRFRKDYAAEAHRLIADRRRDEKGLFGALRLALDLVADFALGLPQAYRNSAKEAVATPVASSAGVPFFQMLDEGKTGPGPFLVGSAISLAAVCIFSFILNLPSPYRPLSGAKERVSPVEAVLERLNQAAPATRTANHRQEVLTAATLPNATPKASSVTATQSLQPESRRPANSQATVANVRIQNSGEQFEPALKTATVPGAKAIARSVLTTPAQPESLPQTHQAAIPNVAIRNTDEPRPTLAAIPVVGDWQGTLLASPQNLQIVVRIGGMNTESLHVLLYRSGSNANLLSANAASFRDGQLIFAIQSIGGRFNGRMSADGRSIVGTWTQATTSQPLLLKRMPSVAGAE